MLNQKIIAGLEKLHVNCKDPATKAGLAEAIKNAKAVGSYADVLHDAATEDEMEDSDEEEEGGYVPEEHGPKTGDAIPGKPAKSNPLAAEYTFPGGGPNDGGGERAKGAFEGNQRGRSNPRRPMTENEWFAAAPPFIRKRYQHDKLQIVRGLVSNVDDEATRNRLGNKYMRLPMEDLEELQLLHGPVHNVDDTYAQATGLPPHFMGAGPGLVANAGNAGPALTESDDAMILDTPVLNMRDVAEENARSNGRLATASR